ncbi:hypothetical protein F4861DRAFT_525704 [Xylaria intraflava]|nr:hypothetical protein F4861DRAFT_525704 [Xylaria intraflava]
MEDRMKTVLVIGATAGIGEALVRRLHALDKTVIATGRNKDKLEAMARDLSGLQTRQLDISELATLPTTVESLLADFRSIDTIIITAGIQLHYSLLNPSSITPTQISDEITTNLTAPALLIRLLSPYLLGLANQGAKTTLLVTSSSLAYVPLSLYPTYCASKAGVQALVKTLRQQLSYVPISNGGDVRVVEIVPPYTDTGLDKAHRESTIAIQGGPEKAFKPMPLDEFIEQFFEALEQHGPDGQVKNEIGVGFGEMGVTLWRDSFGKVYEQMGIST